MSNQPLFQPFLDDLASANATPGGGGAAALSGAMGAALVSMVCNLTIGRKKYADVEASMQSILNQAETLRGRLTEMVAADAVAFDAVMAAYGLPKESHAEKLARNAAIQAATKQATLVPLETARACAQVIALAKPTVEQGNINVISDGGAAVACAVAGLKTAALNVLINLASLTDEAFVRASRTEIEQLVKEYEALAAEIYELVKAKF